MRIVLHSKVYSDISQIMAYYEKESDAALAAEFYRELRSMFLRAMERPRTFGLAGGNLRRANLHRFPYHFLFLEEEDRVKILVVRHHRRHPSFGTKRS